jgi:ATP-dependent Clp protease ATP-binding subunit ClpA
MFNRFAKSARRAAEEARRVAGELGSPTVEAEHVLIAVLRTDEIARRLLSGAGLDEGAIREAVDDEMRRSLAAVGVPGAAWDVQFTPRREPPAWATSAKRVLEGALELAADRGDHRIGPVHVLASALSGARGTLPRALDGAGVDRRALADDAAAAAGLVP